MNYQFFLPELGGVATDLERAGGFASGEAAAIAVARRSYRDEKFDTIHVVVVDTAGHQQDFRIRANVQTEPIFSIDYLP